jgi:hypothetical protein
MLMRKWIQQFRALERPAQRLFLRSSVVLPLISISLRWRGFRKTKACLKHFLSVPFGSRNPDAEARAILTAQIVRAASHQGISDPSCLVVSLALWWLLARQGIASELRVGVRKDGGTFEAHAWVECGRVTLDDPRIQQHHYVEFDTALASLPPEPQ